MDHTEPVQGDAFGRALLDEMGGGRSAIVIERDDGFVDVDGSDYFGDVSTDPLWSWISPRLGRRVLDIGAGAGRGALALQRSAVEVVALDVSPGCIQVCTARGVDHVVRGTVADLAASRPYPFDGFLALGNNLGLIGSVDGAGVFFDALRSLGGPGARLVGTMLDPHLTDNPAHVAYHERNRAAGRLAGSIRIRVRYGTLATEWFSLLWLSADELADVAHRHRWELVATQPLGILYGAELRPS